MTAKTTLSTRDLVRKSYALLRERGLQYDVKQVARECKELRITRAEWTEIVEEMLVAAIERSHPNL